MTESFASIGPACSDDIGVSVVVVLVNWKRAQDTLKCIESLVLSRLDILRASVDIVVVDNCSPDGSFEILRSGLDAAFHPSSVIDGVCRYDLQRGDGGSSVNRILLAKSSGNLGFAGGNNFGLSGVFGKSGATADFYWFLNNDTEVLPDCLQQMLAKLLCAKRKVGICGSTMVYFHDKKTVQALGGSVYKPLTGTMYEIGNGTQWPHPVDEAAIEATMSYVCGASMLVSAQLIKDVGLMQEDYFLFYEEIDWCTRAKKAGYQLAYASQAVVYHKEGAAIGTGVGAKRSLLAEYYGMRNKLMVTRRFFPWALPSVWLVGWAQVLRRALQGRQDNAKIMAQVLCGLGRAPR